MIDRGIQHLGLAASGDTLSEYHLEAAIAACHSLSADDASTDWARILSLYDQLAALNPSPVVALNRAIALARVGGPQAGLDALAAIGGLEGYHLLHAARGAFAAKLGQHHEALAHFQKAEARATLPSEAEFIARRIHECQTSL